jgi:hypothetical protein
VIYCDGMQHASIVAFLSGKISPEALAEEIASEVAAFRKALRLTKNGYIAVSDGSKFLIPDRQPDGCWKQ